MVKTAFSILAVTAAAGIALTPVAASAAVASPAVLALSSSPMQAGPGLPENTTVTFTVTSGTLTMTAPGTVDLPDGAPGTTISGAVGPVTVTDNRALLAASWTATVFATPWTTGLASTAETIPVSDVGYAVGDHHPDGDHHRHRDQPAAARCRRSVHCGADSRNRNRRGRRQHAPRGIRPSRSRFPRPRSAASTRGRSPSLFPNPAVVRGPGCGAARTGNQGENVRRSISFVMFALATGILSILSPVASAATLSGPSAAPGPRGRSVSGSSTCPCQRRTIRVPCATSSTTCRPARSSTAGSSSQNDESRTARFTVYADAAFITGGLFVGYAGATRSELTDWVSVQHPTVTLAAGASVMDMVTVSVPLGATRGEHYGVVWVQQTAKARAHDGESGVTEVSRVGVRLYVAVGRGGAPPTSFDITSVTGHLTHAGQPIIVAHVNNTGGRAIDLNGSARLTNGPGGTSSGPLRAQRIITLAPGQSWNLTFAAPKSLPKGSWQVTVALASGLTKATATATVQFSAIVATQAALSARHWIWVALGGLVIALVVALGWLARQRRRHQIPA